MKSLIFSIYIAIVASPTHKDFDTYENWINNGLIFEQADGGLKSARKCFKKAARIKKTQEISIHIEEVEQRIKNNKNNGRKRN